MGGDYAIRAATLEDRAALGALIARSARELSAADYSAAQIDAALQSAFGVDTQLIADGTYFVVISSAGEMAGCGGWSRRRTLFGSDQRQERNPDELDPRIDAARIRAFFVDPAHARRGIGRALLERCEAEARACGFAQLELMSTLPGVRLYAAHGYVAGPSINHELTPGLMIEFVPMTKVVDGPT